MKKIANIVRRNPVYAIFFLLLFILMVSFPRYIKEYLYFINWKTIATIAGLMAVTTGIEQSAVLDTFTAKIINRSGSELGLAIRLIALSVIFSAFLTNDVSLFILIPVTLHIQKYIKNDVGKLIIFEAIGVNVGSTLTPIGNPQNIYLFHKMQLNSAKFVVQMLPVFLVLTIVLAVFVIFAFKGKPLLRTEENFGNRKKNSLLFAVSVAFIVLYFLFLNSSSAIYVLLALILITYLIISKSVLRHSDWSLLLLFCVMFIDFGVMARIPFIHNLMTSINLNNTKNLFGTSVLLSQIISNVPASIFLSHYSANYRIIAYGVNLGGNGIITGSLANVIALRLSKKNLFLEFHKYSVPFLIITFIITILFI